MDFLIKLGLTAIGLYVLFYVVSAIIALIFYLVSLIFIKD